MLRNGVELVIAHVGDSSSILCRLGEAQRLTHDHCPSATGEKVSYLRFGILSIHWIFFKTAFDLISINIILNMDIYFGSNKQMRIEQSGGEVITDNIGRHMVNGSLNMSRSIGDMHLKSHGVIAIPDTKSVRVSLFCWYLTILTFSHMKYSTFQTLVLVLFGFNF